MTLSLNKIKFFYMTFSLTIDRKRYYVKYSTDIAGKMFYVRKISQSYS